MTKKIKPFSHEDKFIFQWRGPDHIKYAKGLWWYVVAGAVIGLFLLYAFLEKSLVLATLTFTMVTVYFSFEIKNPEEVDVIISEYGIKVGKKSTTYENLKSFRIEHHPPLHALVFITKGHISTEIIIPYPNDIDPTHLKKFLKTKIKMHNLKDRNFIDSLVRITKL